MKKLALLVVLLSAFACKREPDPPAARPAGGSVAAVARDAGALRVSADAGAAVANVRMPIAAAKLEMVGNASIKALEISEKGEVKVGDTVFGTLGADGTFSRDGKVMAELGEGGEVKVDGRAAEPPIRIDQNGDVFVGGDLMMTIDDDGKINTVGPDGAITENVLALLEGPPQGRRAVALLLVLISTTSSRSEPPPPVTR